MSHEKHKTAVALLAKAINRREAELEDMRASYVKLGGVFEEDEEAEEEAEAAPAQPKRLAAPRGKHEIAINGVTVGLTAPQHSLVELLRAATGQSLARADALSIIGGDKTNFSTKIKQINAKLAAAKVHIVKTADGKGYRLEKLP
jgi:DNA-binding response OmpR family regulator